MMTSAADYPGTFALCEAAFRANGAGVTPRKALKKERRRPQKHTVTAGAFPHSEDAYE